MCGPDVVRQPLSALGLYPAGIPPRGKTFRERETGRIAQSNRCCIPAFIRVALCLLCEPLQACVTLSGSKAKIKNRPFSKFRLDPDRATSLLDDSPTNRKPDAGARIFIACV